MTVDTPEGQPYLPDVIKAVVERYRFQSYPSTFDEMMSDPKKFNIGEWNGVQIEDLSAYNDGLIVGGRCRTDVLEGMLEDLMGIMESQFHTRRIPSPNDGRFFESGVVVRFDQRILSKLDFLSVVHEDIETFLSGYGLGPFEYAPSGLISDSDPSKIVGRRPLPFSLARRVSVPYEENLWFSGAPLKTDDHIALLENVEAVMLR